MNIFNRNQIDPANDKRTPQEKKRDKLKQQQKGFDTNRNLSGFLILLLGYYIYDSKKEGTPPIWFYAILGVLIGIAGFIIWRDTVRIKKIQAELVQLQKEIETSTDQ
jgi:hypothetical protein